MEPTLIRRFFVGLLVICLIVGAGAFGWAQGRGGRQEPETDLPAMGGVKAHREREPEPGMELVVRAGEESAAGAREETAARVKAESAARDREESVARGGGRGDPVHRVVQGETLFRIARRYGVQVTDLMEANGLASDLIRPGQLLVVPGGKGTGVAVDLEGEFTWPVLAPISSPYGPRWGRLHKGIDLAANHGDSIRASRGGTVVFAGELPGYGQTIILEHPDGTRTLYAHCSRLLVREGERVVQGQDIALVGSTGQSTGPHLHFEIIVDGEPVDPFLFLPPR